MTLYVQIMNDITGGELGPKLPPCSDLSISDLTQIPNSIFLSINVRGLRNNLSPLQELTSCFTRNNIKIIGLSEVYNIDSNNYNNILEDYFLISRIRSLNPDRGGAGILLHKSIQYEELSIEQEFVEGTFESVSVKVPDLSCTVTSVYRPNGHEKSSPTKFIELLAKHNKTIRSLPQANRTSHYYLGDFNIDLNKTDNSVTREYLNTMITSMYLPTINLITRSTSHSGTCIDQIWTNRTSEIKQAFVINNHQVADHRTIGIIRNDIAYDQTKTIQRRIFSTANTTKFKANLAAANFDEVYNEPSTHSKWSKLTETINQSLEKACPLRTVNVKPGKHKISQAFMTEDLRKSAETLQKLARLSYKNKNQILPGNTEDNWNNYHNYRKTHSKMVRAAKRRHYNECFREIKHSPKKTWEMINKIIKTKTVDNTIKSITVDGKEITDPKEISAGFNTFYANVGKTQAATVPETDTDPMAYLKGDPPDSMFLHPCTPEEVTKTVKQLAKKGSKGPDGQPCNLIFNSIDTIINPITHCINACFVNGEFPDCLKNALVIPLYKKKSRSLCTNYRPVSLLNALSKIVEKVLYARIYNFMGNKLCPTQYGFRPGHATSDLMVYTMESIARNLNSMSNALPLFFDLGKAFDTLKHDLLLKKLNHYGIRGLPLSLISSYLSNRKQKVMVNGVESDYLPLVIGVPQGSILGPLLFIIYVNDITTAAPSEKVALYADDTTCITGAITVAETVASAKLALNNLGEWFAANGLSLSPSKCKFALINDKLETATTKATLSIYGQNLSEVRKGTVSHNNPLVGYLLNENLNNNEHISHTISKIRSGIFALKASKAMPSEILKSIYYATVHSHIAYAGIIIGCAPDTHLKPILNLQKIALRAIESLEYNGHTAPVCKKHKILYVRDILDLQAASMAWKYFHNKLPSSIATFFSKGNDRQMLLTEQRFKSNKLLSISPISYSSRIWNSLPMEAKKAKTLKTFKKSFCTWKLSSYA